MCFAEDTMMDDSNVPEEKEAGGRSSSSNRVEIGQHLQGLSPGRKSLLLKYLVQKEGDSIKILAEYLGVALAFTALGSLMRETKQNCTKLRDGPEFRRKALEAMLKAAMERLRDLALRAHDLETRARELSVVEDDLTQAKESWQSERTRLLQKVAKTEAEAIEMKNKRLEDAKANEKVVAIFASKEQVWNLERKRLTHEIESLKKHLHVPAGQLQTLAPRNEHDCKDCAEKNKTIVELNEKLGERDFLMMASMEEVKVEQHERSELSVKLALAEMLAGELRAKLAREVEEHKLDREKYVSLAADMKAKEQKMECQIAKLKEELEALQEMTTADLKESTENCALLENISREVVELHKELDDKDKMISAMLRKDLAVVQLNDDLATELALVRTRTRSIEIEREKWKRQAEERGSINQGRKPLGTHGTGKSSSDSRLHADKLEAAYYANAKEVAALQSQIQHYQHRVAKLEMSILHISRGKKPDKETRTRNRMHTERNNQMKDPMGADIEAATKKLFGHNIDTELSKDQELDKWKKLYLAAKNTIETLEKQVENAGVTTQHLKAEKVSSIMKTSQTVSLEQRQYLEIEAFERQMRAKDERMEAFRKHLVAMEAEAQKRQQDIEVLRRSLSQAQQEKARVKYMLKERDKELSMIRQKQMTHEPDCFDIEDLCTTFNKESHPKEKVVEMMQTTQEMPNSEPSRSKKKSEDRNIEEMNGLYEKNVLILEHAFQGNKESVDSSSGDLLMEDHQTSIKDAIDTACLEVERLSQMIAEAREQMTQVDSLHEFQITGIVEQAAQVKKSGQTLRKMKDLFLDSAEKGNWLPFQSNNTEQSSMKETQTVTENEMSHVHIESNMSKPLIRKSSHRSTSSSSEKREMSTDDIKASGKNESHKRSLSSSSWQVPMNKHEAQIWASKKGTISEFRAETISSKRHAQKSETIRELQPATESCDRPKMLKHQGWGLGKY